MAMPQNKKGQPKLPHSTIAPHLSLEKISADQQEEEADYPYEDTAQQDDNGCRRDSYSGNQGGGRRDAPYYQRHPLQYFSKTFVHLICI